MICPKHSLSSFAKSLCLAAVLSALTSAPAIAAPSLGVELERDSSAFPTVSHSDERIDYTVSVKNTAPALPSALEVGNELFCDGAWEPLGTKAWTSGETANYGFEFEWLRNGAPIGGWTAGAPGRAYTVQAADEGKALQCLVKGTNGAKTGSFLSASQPVAVVNPQPVVEPPKPTAPADFSRRPTIAGSAKVAGEVLTCTAPAAWSGAPSWTFKWLRNGVEASAGEVTETTATTSKFKLAASEVASKAVFQCLATATNAGGAAVVESAGKGTESPAPEFAPLEGEDVSPNNPPQFVPVVERADNTVFEPVTLELELPGGEETYAFKVVGPEALVNNKKESFPAPLGWSCDRVPPLGAEHAEVICSSSSIVKPGQSFGGIKVATHLGADAPDLARARVAVFGGGASASASDEDEVALGPAIPFSLTKFEAGLFNAEGFSYTQAGGHPHSGIATFELAKKRDLLPENNEPAAVYTPVEHVKQVIANIPRGQVGNALAIPELCPGVSAVKEIACPARSAVGGIHLFFSPLGPAGLTSAIYAVEPEFGTPAQFAFTEAANNVISLSVRLRADEGYALSFESAPAPVIDLLGASVTLCDYGLKSLSGPTGITCFKAGEAGANPKPLFANPTKCAGPQIVSTLLDTWEHPGAHDPREGLPELTDPNWKSYEFADPPITGCEKVKFEPQMNLAPTSHQADSPTGLDVTLSMPTNGLEGKDGEGNIDPEATSQANLKRARITFPKGMAINAAAGQGLGACSAAQVKLKTNLPIECPDSSKIGTVEIETPVIEDTLKGAAYIAKQGDIKGALTGFYLVFDSPKNGILIKMPARIEPQPDGQLVVTVDESPEDPFSAVKMHFPGGPRATLIAPPKCGKYEIKAEISPWSAADPDNPTAAETVTDSSTYEVTEGPNGSPCPKGNLDPKLSAGAADATAGATSPFVFRLFREDGSERFSSLSLKVPLGLTAYLAGIPYCPDSVINSISSALEAGQAEIDHPSCPRASLLGTTSAAAGAGSSPFFVNTGRVYLAGPYKGAPASFAVVAPAVAGPLDLGNVVIRNPVYIDPETTQVTVKSDPIPTIIHGVQPDIRDIRVSLDRPHFTLNPTSCEPKSVDVSVRGESGGNASVSNPFQVAGCEKLGFKPRVKTTLHGPTKRAGHPGLTGVLTPRPGDANLKKAVITIPRSEFLDQAHIRTICTRVQFAANACPKGSIYGHATGITPLLDQPLSGPVYLRSSDHELPDLVATVKGPDYQPIEAAVVGRIDSIKGQIRASFEAVPDVPLSKVTIAMQGGKKGLLINSRDICARKYRVDLELEAHNGLSANSRPAIEASQCGKAGRKAKRGRRHG